MTKRILTIILMLIVFSSMSISMAAADYSYDIEEPDENFNNRMTNASIDVSFNVERDMWEIKMTFNATHMDGRTFTEKDLFDSGGFLYLDFNNEVEGITLGVNGGGVSWSKAEMENGIVYFPFEDIKPDENGICDLYVVHSYIHLWEGHLIHRRTSNVVSVDYEKVLNLRDTANPSDQENSSEKPSSISGVVYDQDSREFIENATVTIGGDTSVTDSGGHFYLYDVKPGNVNILVTKHGYYQLKDHIEVFPDTNYEGVEIQLEVDAGAIEDMDKDANDDGYKEDKEKASSGVSAIAVIGGAIAGAGLLFFRNGLRKKNKAYRKEKDTTYNNSKKIEKELKKLNPEYEHDYVKKIDEEDRRLEKERMDKIKSMKRTDTDSLGTSIGKGIKGLLDKTKQLTSKVKTITDKIQGEIDKLKNYNLASYKGIKFKVGTLMNLVGDPFTKFTKIKDAVDAFHDKNLYKVVKDEIKNYGNVLRKLTDKISLLKDYKKFVNKSKEVKRAINMHKEVNVAIEVSKNPNILLEDNLNETLKNIRNNQANIGTKLDQVGQKIGKLDKTIKDTIKHQTTSFTNDITNELK